MRRPWRVGVAVSMVQGTEDASVSRDTALALRDHVEVEDLRLTFVKGGDHSLSTPDNLKVIVEEIEDVITRRAT